MANYCECKNPRMEDIQKSRQEVSPFIIADMLKEKYKNISVRVDEESRLNISNAFEVFDGEFKFTFYYPKIFYKACLTCKTDLTDYDDIFFRFKKQLKEEREKELIEKAILDICK